MKTDRRIVGLVGVALVGVGMALGATAGEWRPKERWRGFNLVARFWTENAGNWKPWTCFAQDPDEFDFEFMHDFGFNFARVPIDYRLWCKDGTRDEIDDAKVAKLVDPYVAWGRKWGVHVNFCFYFAPGYTVSSYQARKMGDGEKFDLHSNPATLARCCKHWAYFARRYKGVPNDVLSFNLMNEPAGALGEEKTYTRVAGRLVEAIHAIDPDRFVIADGIRCAKRLVPGLVGLPNVGQAFHGYYPGSVTHFHADWRGLGNLGGQPAPVWPLPGTVPSAFLYGPKRRTWQVPLTLKNLPAGKLLLRLGTVANTVTLRADADGRTIWRQTIEMRPDEPDCTNVVYHTQWRQYHGIYTKPIAFAFDRQVGKFALVCEAGDWAEIESISHEDAAGRTARAELQHAWGFAPTNNGFTFQGWNAEVPLLGDWLAMRPHRYSDAGLEMLWRHSVKCIDDFLAGAGKGAFVMIGEFGCHHETPHPVVLDWMEDCLKLWKERDLGWAMWNLRGPFGVVDSRRADVKYENYKGHKLDRRMLELLRRY